MLGWFKKRTEDPVVVHERLTALRTAAYEELFGDKPTIVFPAHRLGSPPNGPHLIDVFAYPLAVAGWDTPVLAVVTNGMSDFPMAKGDHPSQLRRRELIQYLPACTEGHAQRLRDMAWLPLFDRFLLDSRHTITWPTPAVPGTPWNNALFLESILRPHAAFSLDVDGDELQFLWHVPLSDAELAYKQQHGLDELLDRMSDVDLPWLFDEANRPPLV